MLTISVHRYKPYIVRAHALNSNLNIMAYASAPTTPDRNIQAPGAPFIRRAFTAPIKIARQALPSQEAEAQGAETLFAHNAAKIVSFSTSTGMGRRHSSISDSRSEVTEEPTGTLPWASLTERTIAAGTVNPSTRSSPC